MDARPVTPLLQAILNDPQFAWLRPLSELIVRIDETLDNDVADIPGEVDAIVAQARKLVSPADQGAPYAERYQAALQDTRTRCSRIATWGWCSNSIATRRRRPAALTRTIHVRTLIVRRRRCPRVCRAAGSAAQGPFRQDVVVTAAATPVELGTVTRTLTVITRDQIAQACRSTASPTCFD